MFSQQVPDRRLIDLAAQAVGITLQWFEPTMPGARPIPFDVATGERWNPIDDPGTTHLLAAALKISVLYGSGYAQATCPKAEALVGYASQKEAAAAAQRAVTMCAAELATKPSGERPIGEPAFRLDPNRAKLPDQRRDAPAV